MIGTKNYENEEHDKTFEVLIVLGKMNDLKKFIKIIACIIYNK